ncbi:MAG TPA: response regulator [Gammaproteobacteria bacterium]|nr:response regulator [Gammaproteobacteria bacterium]
MTDTETQTGANQVILVVDDSKVIRKAVSTILGDHYQIEEAKNGEEAINFVNQNPGIHCMLLDLWMPDVDGFDVLEALRDSEDSRLKKLPIIVVTGHEDDVEMRSRAITLGATEFIGKPFSAVELRETVRQYVLPPSEAKIVPFRAPESEPEPAAAEPATAATQASPTYNSTVISSDRHSAANEIRQARRSYLLREGENLLQEAIRAHRPISVMRIKVDRVKVLLRKTGTEFTKRTLYRIGKLIEGEIRRKDLVVRLGASDFAIVLPNTSNEEARAVADAIFRMLRYTAFEYGELKFRLTVSGGLVTPSLNDDLDFGELNSIAETRVDQAFTTGGDQLIANRLDDPLVEDDEQPLGLDEAARLLREGKTREVQDQLPELLEQTMPLLLFANNVLDLGIENSLKKLLAEKQPTH